MRNHTHQLYSELRTLQQRLGTSAELADDFDRVQGIAHQLNNCLTAAYLAEATEADDMQVVTLKSVSSRMLQR